VSYKVKEIYYTLQGEGYHAGRPAIFCRFSGCNLWSGREEDREQAICSFCDTDFWGMDGERGGRYEVDDLIAVYDALWPQAKDHKFIVFTGGEPALQLDKTLIDACQRAGYEVAIETNGTLELPENIDWVCVSPKAGTSLKITSGDELKVVYPQMGIFLEDYKEAAFSYFFLQPMDNASIDENTIECIAYCKENPKWRLSIQSHKYLKIK